MKLGKKLFIHDEVKVSIENNKNLIDVSNDLFGYINGKTINVLKEHINKYNIDISHFDRFYRRRKWEVLKRICPQCSKEFTTNEKDNKITCSYQCSNIYFKDKRIARNFKSVICSVCGIEIKVKKQSNTYCNLCKKNKEKENKKKYSCINCGVNIRKTKTGLCKICLHKSEEYRKKMSLSIRKRVEKGIHKGWKSRKGLEPSFSEKYFMNLFDSENIEYVREKKIGMYFADFVIKDRFILEVDGKQHRRRKESDSRKDLFLTEKGYTVYRIEWYRPTSENGKRKLYRQIKELYNIIRYRSNTDKFIEVMNI